MRPEKKLIVQELVQEIEGVNPLLFTDYSGIESDDISRLRSQLTQVAAKYRVVKNRLFQRALTSVGLEESITHIKGPVAIAYGGQDVVEVVKLLVKFAKNNPDTLQIKGGVVDQKSLDFKEIEKLASLPPKNVLIARLVGQIGAPLNRIVMVLQGNIQKLVTVLDNIGKEKGEEK